MRVSAVIFLFMLAVTSFTNGQNEFCSDLNLPITELFQKIPNKHVKSGIQEPIKSITEVDECLETCISDYEDCNGVDWVHAEHPYKGTRCWIQRGPVTPLSNSNSAWHYQRQPCPEPKAPQVIPKAPQVTTKAPQVTPKAPQVISVSKSGACYDNGTCICTAGWMGPKCTEGCWQKGDKHGHLYMGTLNVTKDGDTCQRWDEDYPYRQRYTSWYFLENTLTEAVNYCRTVGKSAKGPWCYAANPDRKHKWNYCSVPACPK